MNKNTSKNMKLSPLSAAIPVVLLVSLTGCFQQSETPKQLADRYWQLMQNGELVEAEKLVSTGSLEHFNHHVQRINEVSRLENSESITYVTTSITTVNPDTNYAYTQNFNTVLVQENGNWKIDAARSSFPEHLSNTQQDMQQLSEELNKSVQENMETIDQAMEESMEMLNEVMQEGSREMGQSLKEMMDKLNDRMKESVDRLREQRERQNEQNQPPVDSTKPNQQSGEGMI